MEGVQVVPAQEHGIDYQDISPAARHVLETLSDGGYEAYLVGGGVRDLMLGLHPKDFDVATNARPEQVRNLFDRCRIIGRRFRLAHVQMGRDRIEIATFRGGHRSRRGRAHVSVTAGGRIVRDNAYGTIDEDAVRRDFTVNALFYEPNEDVVLDFVGGVRDLKRCRLCMIGQPEVRYREDPVRLLRVVRFAAKLNFKISAEADRPISELASLLTEVSPARLFDEVIKIFHSGHGKAAFDLLRDKHLLAQLFPRTEMVLNQNHAPDLEFIRAALANTDTRMSQGLPVSPAFIYAVLMWPDVRMLLNQVDPGELNRRNAMGVCTRRALEHQARTISIPQRHALMIREIWVGQPHLEVGPSHHPERMIERRYFRAAYDFLGLRAKGDPSLQGAYKAWTREQERSGSASDSAPQGERRRRRRRRRR